MNDLLAGDSRELTAKLAYEYWELRGRPLGSPEIDWFAAEKALASLRAYSGDTFLVSSLQLEPYEGPYR